MQTNKGNALVVVIILIVLIAGSFYLLKDKGTEDPILGDGDVIESLEVPVLGTDTEEMTVVEDGISKVVYDVNGFSPKTITVKIGDTVVFENKTGKNASVASDDHPTHLLYPEFDQYKTDQKGNTQFSFTFTKAGTWNYHDHLNANMVGTVIVE
ncbi:MAG: hypothetical protein COV91_00230 [Candidatus Taylorbacteria bacterium CG11_big_fil_rev_8_21_14_0_20_46_11]|uniref:Blue (type 1) copper domain-containing protein n=1 Tax=Candidatus Taylorbacteria bacterium CG11_big_fil_rev_8_21_14_0_20_46_11 TaxID=1975025 RepID=A0A2H0KD73_9BACT|nr:MAG: hypothetical protein COV91_00230 [Candidatus Taylorbacteria bacterium CG11_big_fil_rev_8_21_14_0_20_46_11]